jgi:hypothetical protein
MAVSKRLRYEILRRDNHTCRYCGGSAPDVVLTVNHVVPTALGGSDDPSNLVAACKDCNAGKTSSSPDAPLIADVADRAVQWGAALERWAHLQGLRREDRNAYVDVFDHDWTSWRWGPDDSRQEIPRPGDWQATIWQFFESGLPYEEVEDAVTIACGNDRVKVADTWRYFCGVVWKKVAKMHEGASALVVQSEAKAAQDEWSGEVSPDVQRMYDQLAFSDLPYEMLTAHVDGTASWLGAQMRWVA